MVALSDLWMPILVSAVFVFIASSVIHMATPWHRSDYKKIDGEDKLREALSGLGLSPGEYNIPGFKDMKEMGSEELIQRFNEGPVGFLTMLPNGLPAFGKNLAAWFLYSVAVGFGVAYLASIAELATGDVFRFTGTGAILLYGLNCVVNSIWKNVPWCTTARFITDGVIYGLVTGGVFAWLWPAS